MLRLTSVQRKSSIFLRRLSRKIPVTRASGIGKMDYWCYLQFPCCSSQWLPPQALNMLYANGGTRQGNSRTSILTAFFEYAVLPYRNHLPISSSLAESVVIFVIEERFKKEANVVCEKRSQHVAAYSRCGPQ